MPVASKNVSTPDNQTVWQLSNHTGCERTVPTLTICSRPILSRRGLDGLVKIRILLLTDTISGVGTETARQGGTEVQSSVVQGSGVRNARPAVHPATNGEPQHNNTRFEFCAVASLGINRDFVGQR